MYERRSTRRFGSWRNMLLSYFEPGIHFSVKKWRLCHLGENRRGGKMSKQEFALVPMIIS